MFSFKVMPYKKQDGTMNNCILVTGDNVDSTYPYKEDMQNFGAKWISSRKTWGWYGSLDKNKMSYIISCIVEIARKIDTFDTSILPYEDCCTVFTPKHPKTKPKLSEVRAAEVEAQLDVLERAAFDAREVRVLHFFDQE